MYEVNLIPATSLGRFENIRQFRFWAGVNAIVALVLTAASFTMAERQAQLVHQIVEEERQVLPQRAAVQSIAAFRKELMSCATTIQNCRRIEQRDVPLQILATAAESCRSVGESIEIRSIEIDEIEGPSNQAATTGARYVSTAPPAAKAEAIPKLSKLVRITGTAEGDEQVSALLERLQSSELFAETALESAQAEHEQSTLRSFRIRCRL